MQEANNRTALTIIKGIATAGDASGNRWLWGVGENQQVYYKQIPSDILYEYKVNDNEQRLTVFGSDANVDPWDIEPGYWYMTHDVYTPILVPSLYSLGSAAFIESVRFSMPYNFDLTEGKMSRISQMLNMKGLGAI